MKVALGGLCADKGEGRLVYEGAWSTIRLCPPTSQLIARACMPPAPDIAPFGSEVLERRGRRPSGNNSRVACRREKALSSGRVVPERHSMRVTCTPVAGPSAGSVGHVRRRTPTDLSFAWRIQPSVGSGNFGGRIAPTRRAPILSRRRPRDRCSLRGAMGTCTQWSHHGLATKYTLNSARGRTRGGPCERCIGGLFPPADAADHPPGHSVWSKLVQTLGRFASLSREKHALYVRRRVGHHPGPGLNVAAAWKVSA